MWLPNPRAGLDCKITQSPIPLGCWSNDSDWRFHSLHGEVGLHLICCHVIMGHTTVIITAHHYYKNPHLSRLLTPFSPSCSNRDCQAKSPGCYNGDQRVPATQKKIAPCKSWTQDLLPHAQIPYHLTYASHVTLYKVPSFCINYLNMKWKWINIQSPPHPTCN